MALHRDAGDARGEVDALLSLGWLAWRRGDADAAVAHWDAALAASRRAGHRAGEGGALSALGWAAHHRGDHARARELHEEAAVVRRAIDDRRGAARALAHAAWAAAHLGLHADAATMFDEASMLATRLGAPQVHALALVMAADALLGGSAEHDARLAWQVREEALPVLRAHGHRHDLELAQAVLDRLCEVRRIDTGRHHHPGIIRNV